MHYFVLFEYIVKSTICRDTFSKCALVFPVIYTIYNEMR